MINPMHAALHGAGFGLKGLKTWTGREGPAFQYTLTHHRVPVALVSDDGYGAEIRVEWMGLRWDGTPFLPPDLPPKQAAKQAEQATLSGAARAVLMSVVSETPDIDLGEGRSVKASAEILLGEVVEWFHLRKQVKTKVMMIEDGKTYVVKTTWTPQSRVTLEKTYPRAVFLNASPVYSEVTHG